MNKKNVQGLISVIVPVYNVEEYLDECVQSIVDQTYHDLEIILVDDGSPDNCPSKCDEWSKKDSRIKVVHKQNGGLSDARNAGLKVATGMFIGFVDSDDFIAPSMYSDLLRCLTTHPKAVMAASPMNRNRNGSFSPFQIGKTEYVDGKEFTIEEFMRLFLSFNIDSAATNKLYKQEFVKHGFIKGRINEDYPFLYYNCKECYGTTSRFVMCGTPHYYYRTRENSICHQERLYMDPLLVAMTHSCEEIINDLKTWNTSLIPFVYKHVEFAALKAKGQMILLPESKKHAPDDCKYIDRVIAQQLSLFRPGISMMNRVKIFIFRYVPFLWKLKKEQK